MHDGDDLRGKMRYKTPLMQQLGLEYPILQAPMGGGATTVDLVTTVSDAGALGFIAAAYLTPSQIEEFSREVRARTSRPFGINLFAPTPVPESPSEAAAALRLLSRFHADLGLPPPGVPSSTAIGFDEQLLASLDSGASVFSFTFGTLPASTIQKIKDRGMFVIGTGTTVQEAKQLESSGVDAIVAQGSEAGAHRGTFATGFEAALIGSMALIPQIVDAVSVPVLASGGIMEGRGIVASLALGANAVQMGTAFLTCDESGVPEAYKEAIFNAREDETCVTRAFSGRPARGIVNKFIREFEDAQNTGAILPFPLQNALTRPLRTAAAKQGHPEYLSLWAGQGVRMARRQSARELIERLGDEIEIVLKQLRDL